ncbi:MAG: response regulator transcription factor [Spirochaetales bacterium]|nr:response regulator transcription factor [Spirochaetales bacterium]
MSLIALVEDEKNIRETLRVALAREGHDVLEYANGEDAWLALGSSANRSVPDLFVLDIMMPRMDGIELCRRLRAIPSDVPIIFLSSRDDEIDRVLGLDSGGDDYVCKPFGIRELTARVRASLRRRAPSEAPARFTLVAGRLELDDERYLVRCGGKDAALTVTEFRMLRSLAADPGVVRTREQLMRAAFPEDAWPNDRAADSHVKRIRSKLKAADPGFDGIETVYGLGYRLVTR